jgi:hypothetical protein
MVSEDDLRRVRSTLDLLTLGLNSHADPAKRGDVTALLKKLKESVAELTTGQELGEDTPLETLVNHLPLKTEALKTTPRALAVMDAEDFQKWLADLDVAKRRAEDLLLKQADEWSMPWAKATNKKFAFILLSDMP